MRSGSVLNCTMRATSEKHHPTGSLPRFNQGRAAACVDAEFCVLADLPPDLRVGLFAKAHTYDDACITTG
jgi:hypothetical protein